MVKGTLTGGGYHVSCRLAWRPGSIGINILFHETNRDDRTVVSSASARMCGRS